MTTDAQVNNPAVISYGQGGLFDKDQVKAWLDLVHGTSPGLMHICSKAAEGYQANWDGRTFSEVADAADWIERLDARGDEGIYLRTSTLARPPRPGRRGSGEDSLSMPGFAADIDLAGPGHKHDPAKYEGRGLPWTISDAMELVQEAAQLPQPTLYVHSGGGVYPWWLFDEPVDVSDPEAMKRVQAVSSKIDRLLHHHAKTRDWHYGTGINDAARVLRIPGTVNRKEGLERACTIIQPAAYNFTSFESLASQVAALAEPEAPKPLPVAPRPAVQVRMEGAGLAPGEDFEQKVSWGDPLLLGGAGWTFMFSKGRTSYWRRPGKESGEHSATTGHDPLRDRLYVFSSDAAPFTANEPVTKFYAYALLYHGGNSSLAAAELRRLGFGGERPAQLSPSTTLHDLVRPADTGSREVQETVRPVDADPAQPQPAQIPAVEVEQVIPAAVPVVKEHGFYRPTDMGNGHRMADMFTGKFTWCGDEQIWYEWNDRIWAKDERQAVQRAAEDMTEAIFAESKVLLNEDEKKGKELYKHALASQSLGKITASIKMFSIREGITRPSSDFDALTDLITVHNGTLNIKTRELTGFDPTQLSRRMFGAAHDPAAQAPRFTKFLADVLPDPTMRDYIRRAMGYTLLGQVNQKALFILHGPSNTGKSQFLIMMEKMFGDFGSTAAAAAFKETKGESSNNLHDLRGKRYVTTSETSEQAKLNEEMIKRLTGKDNVVSRQLYEKNITWTPEMTIWMSTNFLPKMNSDDDAMWRRVKPINFNTVFSDTPGAAHTEVIDIAQTIYDAEAPGILNWILEGVREVLEGGLQEPDLIKTAVESYKLESNNVAEFIEDSLNSDILVRSADPSESIEMGRLFATYEEWCKRNRIEHPYGQKRFGNRIRAAGYEVRKISTMRCVGLSATLKHGFFGTM